MSRRNSKLRNAITIRGKQYFLQSVQDAQALREILRKPVIAEVVNDSGTDAIKCPFDTVTYYTYDNAITTENSDIVINVAGTYKVSPQLDVANANEEKVHIFINGELYRAHTDDTAGRQARPFFYDFKAGDRVSVTADDGVTIINWSSWSSSSRTDTSFCSILFEEQIWADSQGDRLV